MLFISFLYQAKEDDLTSEYKEERDELIQKLRSGLKPKEKNGKYPLVLSNF